MSLRSQFPQISLQVQGKKWTYLDSAATTLKPNVVIETMSQYYSSQVANVHRGAHYFADQGTRLYESARATVAQFIGAAHPSEIVFTRGTTEGINLLASSLGEQLKEGDEILLSEMEHHSNLVPWQQLAKNKGLHLRFLKVNASGDLAIESLKDLLGPKTKICSLVWVTNALGTVNRIEKVLQACRDRGVLTIVDAAQAIVAKPVDVKKLDCDFLVFSGHKIYGPTGIGVLYGRQSLLNQLPPYQSGGSMIAEVTLEKSTFLEAPQRFEAGTPHIAGALGLSAAIRFFKSHVMYDKEKQLTNYLADELKKIKSVRIVGEPQERCNIVSFLLGSAHPADVGQILDQQGVAVRTGHHCCQPLMKKMGITGTVRASLGIYNNEADVASLVSALSKAEELLL